MNEVKNRYRDHFTKNCDGLTKLIAWHLDWGLTSEVKLLDRKVARRLGIDIDRLVELQREVRDSGVYFCRRNITTTRYGIHPTRYNIEADAW